MQPHPDPDLLALQALGEPVLDREASEHVAGCPRCSTTLAELARTVRTVRGAPEDTDPGDPTGPADGAGVPMARATSPARAPVAHVTRAPVTPAPVPAHVWQGIAAELGLDPSVRPASVGPSSVPPADVPVTARPSTSGHEPSAADSSAADSSAADSSAADSSAADPADWSGRRRAHRSVLRRSAPLLAVAAAGLAVGVAGTVLVSSLGGQDESQGPRVLAAADLEAFGIGEGTPVTGSARLAALPATTEGADEPDDTAEGSPDRVLQVRLDDLPDAEGDGFLEAWLIDPETGAMVSLGPVDDRGGSAATVELTVPRGLDVDTYSLVDVSAEPLDGDPTHSGDSLLRGTLGA